MACIASTVALLILAAAGAEAPAARGLTEANKERRAVDEMEDAAGWYNGSPEETTLSTSSERVKQGRGSLCFANLIDHTRGEKSHPIGWPRTGKDLAKGGLSDLSGYDFFECWIYTETSRDALPRSPLSINFYHSGPKRSTSLPLDQVKKDEWVRVVIPLDDMPDADDVQRVQFSISESNYKHSDRVAFYIDDIVLTRYVNPAVAELTVEPTLLYHDAGTLLAGYRLVGSRGLDGVRGELTLLGGDAQVARAEQPLARAGEWAVPLPPRLEPGSYTVRLRLLDANGTAVDEAHSPLRVIEGPF
jgi:hypothetical protein